ncbi:MAG: hypothetical protein KBB33_05740 [Candidatus Cloacimonetes bacterium]|jgi:hypothetical protein|nr:hypothetical protein [Candidatus Cloacimonadota bacterium]HPI25719.1 hypothetical protein [Candidatus Cloacimonadota bacterium]
MSKILLYLLAITMLFGLCACESGGNIVIFNRTGFPVMTSVDDGDTLSIAAETSMSFDVDTDTQSFLTGEVSRKVKVKIFGETYSLEHRDGEPTDSTYVQVRAGKTYSAYINPNRASIKVINNTLENIAMVEIWKHKNAITTRVGTMSNIPPLGSVWKRVDYATVSNSFYYEVTVTMESGIVYTYGGPQAILGNNEQLLVDVHLD